jgi:FtsZ-interacting cell division protein YlmF
MMKPSQAAKEITSLAEASARLGGPEMSPELASFLEELAVSPGLKAVRKAKRKDQGSSMRKAPRVGARSKQHAESDMAKTIDELARKLRAAFHSDDQFESVLSDPEAQTLSKAAVVTLYNRIFEEARPIAKSMTKPEVFNAIRRERISRVRSGY